MLTTLQFSFISGTFWLPRSSVHQFADLVVLMTLAFFELCRGSNATYYFYNFSMLKRTLFKELSTEFSDGNTYLLEKASGKQWLNPLQSVNIYISNFLYVYIPIQDNLASKSVIKDFQKNFQSLLCRASQHSVQHCSKIRSKGEPVNISRGMETLGTPHGFGAPPLGPTRLDQRIQVRRQPFLYQDFQINLQRFSYCLMIP